LGIGQALLPLDTNLFDLSANPSSGIRVRDLFDSDYLFSLETGFVATEFDASMPLEPIPISVLFPVLHYSWPFSGSSEILLGMQHLIGGQLAQFVNLTLDRGDECWAGKGSLVSYSPGIEWSLKIPGGASKAARRLISGESVALTLIRSSTHGAHAILSSNEPGKILAWRLDQGAVVTTRGSFVGACGTEISIDVTIARRAGAALFGGAGVFLQTVSGNGIVFVHGAGDFIEYDLTDNQSLLVSTGNLAGFSKQVDYNIQGVAGLRRILFGGEGLFMTKLTGPGKVLLQSLKRTSLKQKSNQ